MKRWLCAIALMLMWAVSGAGSAFAQSVSVGVTVTVEPSPLLANIGPSCAFVVTKKVKTIDCEASLTLEQWTFEPDGWRAMLEVSSVSDLTSGETIPSRNVTLISAEAFNADWGQSVSRVGGPFIPDKAYNGPYNHQQTIAAAKPGFGIGHYTVVLHFQLRAPASQAPGVYVPQWKVSVANSYS